MPRRLSSRPNVSHKKLLMFSIGFEDTKLTSNITSTLTTMTTTIPNSIKAVVNMELEQNSNVDERQIKEGFASWDNG